MEETRDEIRPTESVPSNATWWPSDFMEKLGSFSLVPSKDTVELKESSSEREPEGLVAQRTSQTLWASGELCEPIPNGFYSVILERRLRELFDTLPSLDELYALDLEGLRPDVVLVDANKDKKLSMLKQLALTLVKGLNPSPVAVMKKIAGLVSDFYKRSYLEVNNARGPMEDVHTAVDAHGIQMLGQIRHGSCHSRAILFKVLADTIGLDGRLIMGLPREGIMQHVDSHKHMSVTVVLNSVELLVDLVRFPGQLIPYSAKAIFRSHISPAGEGDSVENDSCDSPLEPNSPVCGFPDKLDVEGTEQDVIISSSYRCRLEASVNASGRSLQNILLRSKMMIEGKLNLSRSEPANSFWRCSRKKIIADQRTACSSPEHSSFRGHGRSILGGQRYSFRDYGNDMAASRSAGASPIDTRSRRRRRCISMIPEIGDDIVRAVRAMNRTLRQHRLLQEQVETPISSMWGKNRSFNSVANFHPDEHDEGSSRKSPPYDIPKEENTFHKAISLPSSPHHFGRQASDGIEVSEYLGSDNIISAWNKVIESSRTVNRPLLPFEEWNIEFSELTVGTRVGIGFFGEVFRGIWNGMEVAIKVLLEQDLTIENIEDFCNEISILSRLRHPNEYMEMGSLYHLIHVSGQKKRLSWRRRLKMLSDICRGLMCIHRMKIAHRDLKSANCLVNKHWTVKICDFGLSRLLLTRPMKDSSSAGTPEWMAPELIRNEPFTEKCDIFSLGVIIWELYTLNRPWEGVPSVQVVYAVANDGHRLEIPEGPVGKLIADCWAEPDERPSCEEILSRLLDCDYTHC